MNILIVDDNADFSSTLSDIVASHGWTPTALNTPESALQFLERHHHEVGLMLLDIEFDHRSAMNGLDVLAISVKKYPAIPVIMISGKGTIETAVRATKLGAFNFIEKSTLSHDRLIDVVSSAAERVMQTVQAQEIMKAIEEQGIIGQSKAIRSVADKIIRYGRTELSVLITGETGTGKKLVAKAIHSISRRNKYNFVTVDIPNIPRELFQSELFGHLRGAFSGAMTDKKGLFHQADRGTLFLDEIGDLPAESQAYLLLPIEEKTLRRVGSLETEPVDIRFVAATDRDLLEAMKNGGFREQLYHRLRECEIYIPPLRERREDIPLIADYYVQKHNGDMRDHKVLSPSAIEYLQNREWNGNVRELASLLRVTLQTSPNEVIEITDLHNTGSHTAMPEHNVTGNIISLDRTRREDLERVDKIKLETMLRTCKGNVSKAAAQLGISRETLHVKIRKYDIDVHALRKQDK
ncbi:MAG: sigma-54-dependent Fis family transcriptional regulator [Candidatus Kapabacteria bacterium]|nr:sigma-54-dependent Fis family transcriptional regulator [Candidatus Kapabacteria bacterium]MBX7154867.1 sigma-54 dependent transcriptional regulator [Bacteroidota bacterium]